MEKTLDIKTAEDIERVQLAILRNEDFVLGEITPIQYKIKLDGGRFTDYDINYIDADIAKIILSHQKNYTKFLKELESKFDIIFKEEDSILQFKLNNGCLEILGDILSGLEVIKNMDSIHQLYAILGLAGMWFGHSAYLKKIDENIKRIEIENEKISKTLNAQEKEDYAKTINKALETIKEISYNKNFQHSINAPKKEIVSILHSDEKANIDNTPLTSQNIDDFEYQEVYVEDIEETEIKSFYIDTYYFRSEFKEFKLHGIAAKANSIILDSTKRIALMNKAETASPVTLEVKYIKDGRTKAIKQVYILDYIHE